MTDDPMTSTLTSLTSGQSLSIAPPPPPPIWLWYVFGKGCGPGFPAYHLRVNVPRWRRWLTRLLLGSVWER